MVAVEDAIDQKKLDVKWKVSRTGLRRKLREINEAQTGLLIEAIKRFFARPDLPTDDALRLAGLID